MIVYSLLPLYHLENGGGEMKRLLLVMLLVGVASPAWAYKQDVFQRCISDELPDLMFCVGYIKGVAEWFVIDGQICIPPQQGDIIDMKNHIMAEMDKHPDWDDAELTPAGVIQRILLEAYHCK